MNNNFAKLIAIAIVGGVAKALFGPPKSETVHIHCKPSPKQEPETTQISI